MERTVHADNVPPPPDVVARPEIIDLIGGIGRGEIDYDIGYERLRSVVEEYLPPNSSLRRGEIVGRMLALALFPPGPPPICSAGATKVHVPADQPARARRHLEEAWNTVSEPAPSPIAADRGVWAMLGHILLRCTKPGILEGYDALHAKKLQQLFPPTCTPCGYSRRPGL